MLTCSSGFTKAGFGSSLLLWLSIFEGCNLNVWEDSFIPWYHHPASQVINVRGRCHVRHKRCQPGDLLCDFRLHNLSLFPHKRNMSKLKRSSSYCFRLHLWPWNASCCCPWSPSLFFWLLLHYIVPSDDTWRTRSFFRVVVTVVQVQHSMHGWKKWLFDMVWVKNGLENLPESIQMEFFGICCFLLRHSELQGELKAGWERAGNHVPGGI